MSSFSHGSGIAHRPLRQVNQFKELPLKAVRVDADPGGAQPVRTALEALNRQGTMVNIGAPGRPPVSTSRPKAIAPLGAVSTAAAPAPARFQHRTTNVPPPPAPPAAVAPPSAPPALDDL